MSKSKAKVVKGVKQLEKKRDEETIHRPGENWTVEKWLTYWLENIAGPFVRYETRRGYQVAVNRHLIPGTAWPGIGRATSSWAPGTGPRSAPLVERTTRKLVLIHLGSDRSATVLRDALAAVFGALPPQLRRSLTWDQGKEMAGHLELTRVTGTGLLLPPREPLATRQQREHERPTARLLPQTHRPPRSQRQGPGRRR
jgi:hypothetical protein